MTDTVFTMAFIEGRTDSRGLEGLASEFGVSVKSIGNQELPLVVGKATQEKIQTLKDGLSSICEINPAIRRTGRRLERHHGL